MDIYWPADSYLISNVAREAKRVAHPCSRLMYDSILNNFQIEVK